MDIPGNNRVPSAYFLTDVDAPIGTKLFVDSESREYTAVPYQSGLGVPGPLDQTRISWIASLSRPAASVASPCVLKLDARQGVIATSTDVDTWTDFSGCANNATQTSTARPTLSPTGWSDGGPCVTFDGSADYLAIDGVLPFIQNTQSKGLAVLFRSGSVASGGKCIFGAGGASQTLLAIQGDTTQLNIFNRPAEGTSVTANVETALATTRDQLLVLSHVDGAGNTKVFFEGKEYTVAGDMFAAGTYTWTHAAIGCTLGGGTTPSNYFNGKIRNFELYSGALAAADYVAICQRILGRKYVNIVNDGNSLTLSQEATGGFTYPAALGVALGSNTGSVSVPTNLGVGGQTTPLMIADFATQVAPLVQSCATNVLVAWEVTNDLILNGATYSTSTDDATWSAEVAARVVQNFWQYCDLGRAAGYLVVAVTGTDRTGFSAKQRVAMQLANTLLVAQWPAHVDALARVDLQPQLMAPDNDLYSADGTHYTNAGYGIVAQTVARTVSELLASRGL